MTTEHPRVWSDLPIPPGEALAEELAVRGMTGKELAAQLGRPAEMVDAIIRAEQVIDPDTARGLEKALGIAADFWLNLESTYRLTLARNRERESLAARAGNFRGD